MNTSAARQRAMFVLILAASLLLCGCAPRPALPTLGVEQPEPTELAPSAPALRMLGVEAVTVEIGVGSPIPVDIVASGTWPDLCAQLADATMVIDGTDVTITLRATPADPACPVDLVGLPFRIAVPLNVVQLPQGQYAVTVNSVSTTFVWPQP